jgi:hypothetical protein
MESRALPAFASGMVTKLLGFHSSGSGCGRVQETIQEAMARRTRLNRLSAKTDAAYELSRDDARRSRGR